MTEFTNGKAKSKMGVVDCGEHRLLVYVVHQASRDRVLHICIYLWRASRGHGHRRGRRGVSPSHHLVSRKHSNEVQTAGLEVCDFVLAPVDFELVANSDKESRDRRTFSQQSHQRCGSNFLFARGIRCMCSRGTTPSQVSNPFFW